jgi:methylaspartate mutase sigma subunit
MSFPMNPRSERPAAYRGRVVLAVPQSDCHVVGAKLLEVYLQEHYYEVHNLGVCTPNAEIAAAVAEFEPLALLIGSQNGHGLKDLADLRDHLRAFGINDAFPVFVGGNLSVGAAKDADQLQHAFAAIGIVVLGTFEDVEAALRHVAAGSGAQRERANADA